MCMYMCVCIYICVYKYMYVYMNKHTSLCIHRYINCIEFYLCCFRDGSTQDPLGETSESRKQPKKLPNHDPPKLL